MGWGLGKEQGRKDLATLITAQWLTMVQNRTNESWSKRCPRYTATIKNQTRPLLVHCSETKKIALTDWYKYQAPALLLFLKVFPFVFARPSYLITIYICSATTTRGRHKAWKSFSVSTSWWAIQCTIPATLDRKGPSSLFYLLWRSSHRTHPSRVYPQIRNFLYWRILS